MGKSRDLFKIIRLIKGTYHERGKKKKKSKKQKQYGPNRGRRSGKNTQKNYTEKVLMIQITMMGWSLTQNQTFWVIKKHYYEQNQCGDRISAEICQILKDDAIKMLYSICRKFGKLSDYRTRKCQFSFQSQRRIVARNVQSTRQLQSFFILMLCSKSFKLGFSST